MHKISINFKFIDQDCYDVHQYSVIYFQFYVRHLVVKMSCNERVKFVAC